MGVNLLSSREIFLSSYQYKMIKFDLPITHILNIGKKIYFTGRHSLWVWNYPSKKLNEIKLLNNASDKNETLSNLAKHEQAVFVSSSNKLFKISSHSSKILMYENRNTHDTDEISHAIEVHGDDIFWIRSESIWKTKINLNTVQFWKSHPRLKKKQKFFFDHKQGKEKLWILDVKNVYQYDYHKESKTTPIATESKFKDISHLKDTIILSNERTIFVLNLNGKLIKTIPVSKKRKLLLANFTEANHRYLFSDNVLETYSADHSHSLTKLNLGTVKEMTSPSSFRNYVTLITDGWPRIFQLERKE